MNCRKTQQWFAERLDGRLDETRQRLWEAHLADCAACRQEWADYTAAWETLGRAPAVAPSAGFVERTLRRLDDTPAPEPGRWSLVLRWAALAAVVTLTGWTGWVGYQRLQNERLARVYEAVRGEVLESEIVESLNYL